MCLMFLFICICFCVVFSLLLYLRCVYYTSYVTAQYLMLFKHLIKKLLCKLTLFCFISSNKERTNDSETFSLVRADTCLEHLCPHIAPGYVASENAEKADRWFRSKDLFNARNQEAF